MSARTETAPKIVLSEAELIGVTRTMLKRAGSRVTREAYGADRPQDYGRLAEAIDNAEGALFNVLNVASSFLGCVASKAILNPNREEEQS